MEPDVISPLQQACKERGAGPTALADVVGLSTGYVSLIIAGKREPPAHVKIAIAKALGKRPRDLWPLADGAIAS